MITRLAALAAAIIVTGLLSWLWPRLDRPPTRFEVARQLLDDGRPQDAALLFEDPMWRGVAQYRAERYERALGDFYSDDAPSALTLYNLGVTHARMLEWTHAAAHFDKVLRLDPDHADARRNLEIALKAIAMARSQTGENPRESPLEQEGDDKQDPSAYGEPEQQAERLERETHRSTLLKARESAQAVEILLRHIQDDPKKVLRARFYRAHQARKAAGQP